MGFPSPRYSQKSKKIQKSKNQEIQKSKTSFFGQSKKPLKIRSFLHQKATCSSFRCRDIARNPKIKKSRNLKRHFFWKIQKALENPVVLTSDSHLKLFSLPRYSQKSKKNPEIQKSRNTEIQKSKTSFFVKSEKPSKIWSF